LYLMCCGDDFTGSRFWLWISAKNAFLVVDGRPVGGLPRGRMSRLTGHWESAAVENIQIAGVLWQSSSVAGIVKTGDVHARRHHFANQDLLSFSWIYVIVFVSKVRRFSLHRQTSIILNQRRHESHTCLLTGHQISWEMIQNSICTVMNKKSQHTSIRLLCPNITRITVDSARAVMSALRDY
jgi:hypothetical protein